MKFVSVQRLKVSPRFSLRVHVHCRRRLADAGAMPLRRAGAAMVAIPPDATRRNRYVGFGSVGRNNARQRPPDDQLLMVNAGGGS